MSASTVSITGQGPTTRRRAAEKNLPSGGSDLAAAPAGITESEARDGRLTAGDTATAILRDARRTPAQLQAKKHGAAKTSSKPRWVTLVSIITKNLALLVVLMGFIQMVRWTVMNSGRDIGDLSIVSGDFEGQLSEVKRSVAKTMNALQVQMNAMDHKLEDGIGSVRKELDEKFEKMGAEVDLKLKALDVRSDAFEKFMDGFESKSLLSKEEFAGFFEEFKKSRKDVEGDSAEVTVDKIMDYAREIVLKEIERHEADGLGKVDYALASGGARVVMHSEPYGGKSRSSLWSMHRNCVSAEAERMIRPSFGEPGNCFALKGGSGFVEIKLRTAIVPEAVTLEHVAKSVAYDRSSAPKHCRVSGWLQTSDSEFGAERMLLLTEFTYDLEKSNAQTFKVVSAPATHLVDTIRLDFTSNHGSASHTCVYRLRVHGREPSPFPALEMQS